MAYPQSANTGGTCSAAMHMHARRQMVDTVVCHMWVNERRRKREGGLRCGAGSSPFLQDLHPTNLEKGWQGLKCGRSVIGLMCYQYSELLGDLVQRYSRGSTPSCAFKDVTAQERIPDPSHHVPIPRPLSLGMAQQRRILESSPVPTSVPAGQRGAERPTVPYSAVINDISLPCKQVDR